MRSREILTALLVTASCAACKGVPDNSNRQAEAAANSGQRAIVTRVPTPEHLKAFEQEVTRVPTLIPTVETTATELMVAEETVTPIPIIDINKFGEMDFESAEKIKMEFEISGKQIILEINPVIYENSADCGVTSGKTCVFTNGEMALMMAHSGYYDRRVRLEAEGLRMALQGGQLDERGWVSDEESNRRIRDLKGMTVPYNQGGREGVLRLAAVSRVPLAGVVEFSADIAKSIQAVASMDEDFRRDMEAVGEERFLAVTTCLRPQGGEESLGYREFNRLVMVLVEGR